jgi:hypothetical protein
MYRERLKHVYAFFFFCPPSASTSIFSFISLPTEIQPAAYSLAFAVHALLFQVFSYIDTAFLRFIEGFPLSSSPARARQASARALLSFRFAVFTTVAAFSQQQ